MQKFREFVHSRKFLSAKVSSFKVLIQGLQNELNNSERYSLQRQFLILFISIFFLFSVNNWIIYLPWTVSTLLTFYNFFFDRSKDSDFVWLKFKIYSHRWIVFNQTLKFTGIYHVFYFYLPLNAEIPFPIPMEIPTASKLIWLGLRW